MLYVLKIIFFYICKKILLHNYIIICVKMNKIYNLKILVNILIFINIIQIKPKYLD